MDKLLQVAIKPIEFYRWCRWYTLLVLTSSYYCLYVYLHTGRGGREAKKDGSGRRGVGESSSSLCGGQVTPQRSISRNSPCVHCLFTISVCLFVYHQCFCLFVYHQCFCLFVYHHCLYVLFVCCDYVVCLCIIIEICKLHVCYSGSASFYGVCVCVN